MRGPINKNAVTVIRTVQAFCDAARQKVSPFNVCIGSGTNLVRGKEGDKTNTFLTSAWILVVILVLIVTLILVIKVGKITTCFTGLLITPVNKNTASIALSNQIFCDLTRHKAGSFNICVGPTIDLVAPEEGHQTSELLIVALIVILEAR